MNDMPAVAVDCAGDAICVDLRWISASDDNRLAETLGGTINAMPSS
jgi:hypothetical protein